MKIILVSHPARADHVHKLQHSRVDILATVVNTVSARSGHMAALRIAAQSEERVAIMEDDAIPIRNFDELSNYWAMVRQDDMLSFYLGTGRPRQFQRMIEERINSSTKDDQADIWLPTLIHGVCYSLPTWSVNGVLARMGELENIREADFAVGAAWGTHVCYPIESLVQHRDEAPVERHPDGQVRKEPRVARCLAGPLMFNP